VDRNPICKGCTNDKRKVNYNFNCSFWENIGGIIFVFVCIIYKNLIHNLTLKSHNFANYYSSIWQISRQQWTDICVSVPSNEYFERKIYIGLLSGTVAVHKSHWRYNKTLTLQFSAERIWSVSKRVINICKQKFLMSEA